MKLLENFTAPIKSNTKQGDNHDNTAIRSANF